MTERNVTLQAGGFAQWGRQVPLSGEVTMVGYEADWMTKLSVDDDAGHRAYCRTVFIGMDTVQPNETISTGYGFVSLEDIKTGDWLRGHIEWRVEDGQDYGRLVLDDGSGFWRGAAGTLELRLDWSTKLRDASLKTGEPVQLIAFLEGSGTMNLPD